MDNYPTQSFEGYSMHNGGPPVMYSVENPYDYSVNQPPPYVVESSEPGFDPYNCGPMEENGAYDNCFDFMNTPDTYPYAGSPSSTITEDGSTTSSGYYYPVYSEQYPGECTDKVQAAADSSSHTPDLHSRGSQKHRKRRSPEMQLRQRSAANDRERRRMLSINKAFESLRYRVPTLPYEKRLSKVDTLRLTIGYIRILEDLLKNDDEARAAKGGEATGDNFGGARPGQPGFRAGACRPPPPKKVVIECHAGGSSYEEAILGNAAVCAHSLSWNKQEETNRNNPTLTAKLWVPHAPTSSSTQETPQPSQQDTSPFFVPVKEDSCF